MKISILAIGAMLMFTVSSAQASAGVSADRCDMAIRNLQAKATEMGRILGGMTSVKNYAEAAEANKKMQAAQVLTQEAYDATLAVCQTKLN